MTNVWRLTAQSLICFSDLVQKAKKAKEKLLKREGDDRTDTGAQERYESFSYGGVDPYMWEPQELGKKTGKPYVMRQIFC